MTVDSSAPKAKKRKTGSSKQIEEVEVTVTDPLNQVFEPVSDFSSLFSKKIMRVCKNFEKPTQIQSYCWPILKKGRDIIGIAQTGSGKTLAFALPVLDVLKKESTPITKARVLVLSPTRELALQINECFLDACKKLDFGSVCLYGGVSKGEQKRLLSRSPGVIVATPGRLIDLVNEGAVDLSSVDYLVLDEADRMLDLGFERDVRSIIECTKKKRQTLMFSATWPESIQKMADSYLKDAVKVVIGSDTLQACQSVSQEIRVMDPFDKDQNLLALLKKLIKNKQTMIIIFVLYKKEADRVHHFLRKNGFKCQVLHGDKNQEVRTKTIANFKDGSEPLLIATDVAARGLDVPNVQYVINYTFPLTIEDYVHRIGRTGRGGNSGASFTFFTVHDKARSGELVNVLKEANQEVPEDLTRFGTTVKKKEHKDYGAFYRPVDPSVKSTHIVFE